jgi:hypothetical protein
MVISSRTPEGEDNHCPVCDNVLRLEPSRPPGDAPCPCCGVLVWFPAHAIERPSEPALAGGRSMIRRAGRKIRASLARLAQAVR